MFDQRDDGLCISPALQWSSSKMYNWVGWACRTEILFSSPWLSLHLKVFTKLHDSVSRIQNFPASADRVWGSNTPLKHCACKAKNIGSFSDKSRKNRGHLGTFIFKFQPIWGLWVKNFKNFGQWGKIEDFGRQFLVKTGVFGWCKGWK